jgi:hypothetical protein
MLQFLSILYNIRMLLLQGLTFSTTSTKSWARFSTPVCVRWILMLSSHPPFFSPPSGQYPRSCHTKITYAFLVSPLCLVTGHCTVRPITAPSVSTPSSSCCSYWLTNLSIQQFSGQTLPVWPHCVLCFGTSYHSWPTYNVTLLKTRILRHDVWTQLSQVFTCLTQRNCLTCLWVMLRGDRVVHDSSYQGLNLFVILGL